MQGGELVVLIFLDPHEFERLKNIFHPHKEWCASVY